MYIRKCGYEVYPGPTYIKKTHVIVHSTKARGNVFRCDLNFKT